jgi:hypothetical protein
MAGLHRCGVEVCRTLHCHTHTPQLEKLTLDACLGPAGTLCCTFIAKLDGFGKNLAAGRPPHTRSPTNDSSIAAPAQR